MHSLYLHHNMCIFTILFVKDEEMVQKYCGVVPTLFGCFMGILPLHPTLFGCFMGILPLHALVMISIPYSHTVFSFQGHVNSNGLSLEGSFTPDSKYIMSGAYDFTGKFR